MCKLFICTFRACIIVFQESRAEDDSLETLCENVTELIKLLEEEGSKPIETKGKEVIMI